uniref:hypothetical protein n=1 Tax=Lactobacillus delbrueckii TaxID=1584 RepID=UPI0030C82652
MHVFSREGMLAFEFAAVFNRKRSVKAIEKIIHRVCDHFCSKNRSKTSANMIEKIIYRFFAPAGALLADHNHFRGINLVRFGANLNIMLDRKDYEGISVLDQ